MDLAEVAELLKPIKQNYPFFDASKEAREHYLKYLKDFPFEVAQQNVDRHIMTEKNQPTVAHIRGQLVEQNQHYELKEVAIELADQIEVWQQTAVPMPEHTRVALKQLGDKFRI